MKLEVGVTALAQGTNTGAFGYPAALLIVSPLGVAGGVTASGSIGASTAAGDKSGVLGGVT